MSKAMRLAVLGDPIDHSLSPVIHSAALTALGIEGTYVAVRADEAILRTVVEDVRTGSLDGVNVTMPLKAAAFALCDELTPEAASTGSVNTIRSRGGVVEGHSTDAVAMAALISERFVARSPLLILGAGSTARVAALVAGDRDVYVSARREDQVEAMLGSLSKDLHAVPFGNSVARAVVINCTSIGMRGERLPDGVLEAATGLVDLPYGREMTPAIEEAGRSGIPAVDGVEFLVAQAALSFEWWTGLVPPADAMLSAVRAEIKGRQTSQGRTW